jgi:hypothetical protein
VTTRAVPDAAEVAATNAIPADRRAANAESSICAAAAEGVSATPDRYSAAEPTAPNRSSTSGEPASAATKSPRAAAAAEPRQINIRRGGGGGSAGHLWTNGQSGDRAKIADRESEGKNERKQSCPRHRALPLKKTNLGRTAVETIPAKRNEKTPGKFHRANAGRKESHNILHILPLRCSAFCFCNSCTAESQLIPALSAPKSFDRLSVPWSGTLIPPAETPSDVITPPPGRISKRRRVKVGLYHLCRPVFRNPTPFRTRDDYFRWTIGHSIVDLAR